MNYLAISLCLQVSILAALAIATARLLKNRAALRYSLLYATMLFLLPLVALSVTIALKDQALMVYQLPKSESLTTLPSQADVTSDFNRLEALTSAVTSSDKQLAGGVSHRDNRLLTLSPLRAFWLIWLLGITLAITSLLRSAWRLRRLAAESRPLPAELADRVSLLLAGELEGSLQVRLSSVLDGPALIGFQRQVLLLPQSCTNVLSDAELHAVLLHELAHFKRRDSWQNLFQKLVLAVFWVHPLVHLMDRMITRAREEICDNHVLANHSACDYGEALLQISLLQDRQQRKTHLDRRAPTELALGILDNNWKLELRISELLDEQREKTMNLKRSVHSAVLTLVAGATVVLAVCQVDAAENTSQAQNLSAEQRQQVEDFDSKRQALEEQLNQHESELSSRLEQLEERLAERDARHQKQTLFAEGQLAETLQEIERELSMVYRQVQEELEKEDFVTGIDSAIEEIRQELRLLEGDEYMDEPYVDITRKALESALQSLETIDVAEMREQILRSLMIDLAPPAQPGDIDEELAAPEAVPLVDPV